MPYVAYVFMICHRMGLPPTSTIGFGRRVVSSLSREPIPPARMTAFMSPPLPSELADSSPTHSRCCVVRGGPHHAHLLPCRQPGHGPSGPARGHHPCAGPG